MSNTLIIISVVMMLMGVTPAWSRSNCRYPEFQEIFRFCNYRGGGAIVDRIGNSQRGSQTSDNGSSGASGASNGSNASSGPSGGSTGTDTGGSGTDTSGPGNSDAGHAHGNDHGNGNGNGGKSGR